MKVKFNKMERIAGAFVILALLGGFAFLIGVATRQGWFENKIYLNAYFQNADGVHPGTVVQMAGLYAGSVEEVELLSHNKIRVHFYILARFGDKVRDDSSASLIRPFIIGERVLDVSIGQTSSIAMIKAGDIKSQESIDLMTLISGKKMGDYLESASQMMGNLKTLADAFLDSNRTGSLVQSLERIDPLLKNLNMMSVEVIKLSKQVTKDDNIGAVVSELALTTKQLNTIMPELSKRGPEMAKTVEALIQNLATLTAEFKTVIPALHEVAPDLPAASRRALEALDEAVVLLKAMQKSFLVKGNAEDVREKETIEVKSGKRVPIRKSASESPANSP